jgi:hypothetical protein
LGEHLLRRHSDLTWRFNPYDATVFRSGVRPDMEEDTRVLELTGGFDVVRRGYTKGAASAVAKALRHGVTVRIAAGVDDWCAYYRVYEDSLRRWGERASSRYGWELFDALQRRGSPRIRLWLALHSGKIVAGALCFYAKRHAVYWHGAALSDSFPMSPVNLLMNEAIRDACGRGYAWFDFNPSGGHEGVEAFKKHFGAKPLPCPLVVRRASASAPSILERIRSSLHRCGAP